MPLRHYSSNKRNFCKTRRDKEWSKHCACLSYCSVRISFTFEVICVEEHVVLHYSSQHCEMPKHKNTLFSYFMRLLHPHQCAIITIWNTQNLHRHILLAPTANGSYELLTLGWALKHIFKKLIIINQIFISLLIKKITLNSTLNTL